MTAVRATMRLGWRRTKRMLEFLVYGVLDRLVLWTAGTVTPVPGRAAVVHVELLGDLFLWLPFGKVLADALREQGQEVTLICSQACASLVAQELPGCRVVAIDRQRFIREWRYRAIMLRELRRIAPSQTFAMTYPRDGIVLDAMVLALAGPATTGWAAEFGERPGLDRVAGRRAYTCLLPPLPHVHQQRRYAEFLRACGVAPPRSSAATPSRLPADRTAADSYILVAPGASRAFRKWPGERFAALARRVLQNRSRWRCIVVGTDAEYGLAQSVVAAIGSAAVNMAGKTNPQTLLELVAGARLVVGNDSAIGHMAAYCGTNSVVAVGGGHFGRCYPYDGAVSPCIAMPVTVYQPMDCFGCNWICRYRTVKGDPYPCMQLISVDAMWAAMEPLLAVDREGDSARTI